MKKVEEIPELVKRLGLVVDGHFVYTSGAHGPKYARKRTLFAFSEDLNRVAMMLALKFADDNVDVIIAPAVGGAMLAVRMADWLTLWNSRTVHSVYAEKQDGKFVIPDEYKEFVEGKRALIVDDVLNKGTTIFELMSLVWAFKGTLVAVGAFITHGHVEAKDLNIEKLETLYTIEGAKLYDADDCPLCKQGAPVNEWYGHGREFLMYKKARA